MARFNLIDPASASQTVKPTLDQMKGAFGVVSKAFASSPAALAGIWDSFGALGSGTAGAKLAEPIAVAVAHRNACNYCLAAHTALGQKAGASAADMFAAQIGQSDDPTTAAALDFALKLVDARGGHWFLASRKIVNRARTVHTADAGGSEGACSVADGV